MKCYEPGEQHVVIVTRVTDGAVGLFYAREPANWLVALANHVQVESVEVRPSAAAPKVIEQLRKRFASSHTPYDTLPWFLADFRQVLDALNAIDLATGEPIRDLQLDAPVMVFPQRTRGTVVGYTKRGLVAVKITGTEPVCNVVLALRDQVKPILRARAA